jgi:ABC-type sugar transport system ATPase subunit
VSASVTGLRKSFLDSKNDRLTVLDGVDLEVPDGELIVIVGPSGSGKTTLLRCIAGLEHPDEGSVFVGGKDVTGRPAGVRNVAMVFQDFALFPHLTARDNISFGLRANKAPKEDIDRLVLEASNHLELENVLDRRPQELSGGERQRVALARAIVREPDVFLLDEPLSNLDAELRATTRAEIRALQRRLGTTTIYVTHDQVEAMTMGDRVAVLRAGRLEQVATPTVLYDRPATAFVARFLGSPPMNLFPSSLLGVEDGAPILGVRPEHVVLTTPVEGVLRGRVSSIELLGDIAIAHVQVGDHSLAAKVLRETAPQANTDVGISIEANRMHEFESMNGPAR